MRKLEAMMITADKDTLLIVSGTGEVIEPEEIAQLSDKELFRRIEVGLAVKENCVSDLYRHNRRAEYLERAVYVCPFCGFSKFESHDDVVTCCTCKRQIRYGEDKQMQGIGFEFPFTFMAEWYDYQNNYVNHVDPNGWIDKPVFRDEIRLSEVILYDRKQLLRKHCTTALYGDRIVIDDGTERELVLPFSEVTAAACLGKNKANIYHNDHVYQFKGSKRFNALKYVNLYFRHKNITQGTPEETFLGL